MQYRVLCGAFCAVIGLITTSHAQWVTQEIQLSNGWNAICFHIDPVPSACDDVFGGSDVEQVLAYNDLFTTVQFVTDPTTNFNPQEASWLKWYADPSGVVSQSLHQVHQGRGYLVKSTNASPFTLTVTGRARISLTDWREDRYNLVGFAVDTNSPPSFAEFFGPSPEHDQTRVYRMINETWKLADSTNTMRSGEAFWIFVNNGESAYQGPLAVVNTGRDGLNYAATLAERSMTLRNDTTSSLSFTLEPMISEEPPPGDPPRAGEVPLSWWDAASGPAGEWRSFPSTGFTQIAGTLTNDVDAMYNFAVRRSDFGPFTPPPGESGRYASVLKFTAMSGRVQYIPVVASGLNLPGSPTTANASHVGLWAGEVQVRKVSQSQGYPDQVGHSPTEPVPVGEGSEYLFRVLWHLDEHLNAMLLSEAAVVWVDGTYTNNADGIASIEQPGRFVIVTGTNQVSQFTDAELGGDTFDGRRMTATAFGIDEPIPMIRGSNALVNTFTTASNAMRTVANDRLNPSRHTYHRLHKAGFLGVNRVVSMAFLDQEGGFPESPQWGDRFLGGVWTEEVTGLRHETIYVEGGFMLRKISDLGVLNE